MKSLKDRIVVTVILGSMTLVAFGAAFWGFSDQLQVMREGEVIDATVERVWFTHGGGRRGSSRLHIEASYMYDGVRYTDEVAIGQFSLLWGPDEGDNVRVTVVSEQPGEAWLASDLGDWLLFSLGPLVFVLVGILLGMFALIIGSGKGKV